jgi:uncharacterized membrane protein
MKMATPQETNKPIFKIAIGAVFAALVCIVTVLFILPIPATNGYFNLGESIIFIAALTFGPFVGSITGGGAAIADLISGFYIFAPGTLIIKTLEGLIVGFTNKKMRPRVPNVTLRATIAVGLGGAEMILGYFIYEQLVLGYPLALALAEVPFNFVQVLVGLIVAVPIMHAVFRVFPQFKS